VQRLLCWGAVVDIAASGDLRRIPGPVFVAGNTGFYHFIAEVLPSLCHVLQWKGALRVLIASESPAYVRDGVRLASAAMGMPVTAIESSGSVATDVIRFAAFEPLSGFVPEADVAVLSRLRFAPKRERHAVYVSRTRTARRSLREEEELESMLRTLGVRVVHAETMPLGEQIELFSGAWVVVGMHGAGLVNILWSNCLEHVIEVFPPGVRNDCYARLSVQLGAGYQCVTLEERSVSQGLRLAFDLVAQIMDPSPGPARSNPRHIRGGAS
jgi:capsular polysaccharide biosynthesis protein